MKHFVFLRKNAEEIQGESVLLLKAGTMLSPAKEKTISYLKGRTMTTLISFVLNVSMVVNGVGSQENLCDLHLDNDCKSSELQMLESTMNSDNNIIHHGVDVDEKMLEKYSNFV